MPLQPWLVLLRLHRKNITLQLITLAVTKPVWNSLSIKNHIILKSVNSFAKQSIYRFLHDTSCH